MASKYSVLMSVYHREKPEYLKQAIESIQAQTLPTDDFVRCIGWSDFCKATGDGYGAECCSSRKERWTWKCTE